MSKAAAGIPTGRVTVAVRLRPVNDNDDEEMGSSSTSVDMDVKNSRIRVEKRSGEERHFNYDHCLPPDVGQSEVYERMAAPIVLDVMQGFNGTVLAYGQTGTGKTFTLGNNLAEKSHGIIPRAFAHIFRDMESDPQHAYEIHISYVQIYCEMIQDLLQPDNNSDLRIREGPDAGVYISGVTSIRVHTAEEALQLMGAGNENRATAFTQMNAHSSRSHACLIVNILRRTRLESDDGTAKFGKLRRGKLTLVDLAGSERVKKSGATGNVLTEAKSINLSLTCLGNVIHALTDRNHKHIPYRDSKLTRLLQDSLGGNAKTSLVATIGPSSAHVSETISTLLFAQRAMKVQTYAVINEEVDYKALCAELQAELDSKDDAIHAAELRVAQAKAEAAEEFKRSNDARVSEEALKALRAELEAEKATMKSMLEGDMAAVRRAHEREIQQLKTTFDEALKQQKKEHTAELREQKLDHHQELTGLMEEFEHQIMFHDDEEDKWKQERTSLQKQVQAERSALALTVNESMEKDQIIHQLQEQVNQGHAGNTKALQELEQANSVLTQELQNEMKRGMMVERLEKSLASMTTECQRERERVEELEEENDDLIAKLEAAKQQSSESNDNSSLRQELETARQRISELENDNRDLLQRVEGLEEALSQTRQDNGDSNSNTGNGVGRGKAGEEGDPEVASLRKELITLTETLKLEMSEFDEIKEENAMLRSELADRADEFARLQEHLSGIGHSSKPVRGENEGGDAVTVNTIAAPGHQDQDEGEGSSGVAVLGTPAHSTTAGTGAESVMGKTPGRRKQEFNKLLRDIDSVAALRDENVSLRNELITLKMENAEINELTTENANLLLQIDRLRDQHQSECDEAQAELSKLRAERDTALQARGGGGGGASDDDGEGPRSRGGSTSRDESRTNDLQRMRETNDLLNAENEAQRAELEQLREERAHDVQIIAELRDDMAMLQEELGRDSAGKNHDDDDDDDDDDHDDELRGGGGGEVGHDGVSKGELRRQLAEAKAAQARLERKIEESTKQNAAARTIQHAYRGKRQETVVKEELIILKREVEAKEADLRQTQSLLQERVIQTDQLGAKTGRVLMDQSMTHIELAFRHLRNFFLEEHSQAWKAHKALRAQEQAATGLYPNSKMQKKKQRRHTVAGQGPPGSSSTSTSTSTTAATTSGTGAGTAGPPSRPSEPAPSPAGAAAAATPSVQHETAVRGPPPLPPPRPSNAAPHATP